MPEEVDRRTAPAFDGPPRTSLEPSGITRSMTITNWRRLAIPRIHIDGVDQPVVRTGSRPNLSSLPEVRLDLDPTLQASRRLAAEVDPNIHSCGSVQATGALDLAQPEPDFYLLGTKSYGRAPTFLAMTGYEQVRSVVTMLAGDRAAAERAELALPETGVCGGSGLYGVEGAAGSCCTPSPALLQIGLRPVGAR